MAIFVACLGLFGLASFAAEQRTKEIGVRKVLGASEAGLAALLSKEFLKGMRILSVRVYRCRRGSADSSLPRPFH